MQGIHVVFTGWVGSDWGRWGLWISSSFKFQSNCDVWVSLSTPYSSTVLPGTLYHWEHPALNTSKSDIAVRGNHHTTHDGKSHVIWDHTMLRTVWSHMACDFLYRLYPIYFYHMLYGITQCYLLFSDPGGMQHASWVTWVVLMSQDNLPGNTVTYLGNNGAVSWQGIEPTPKSRNSNILISFVRPVRDYCILIDLELFQPYVVLNIPLWLLGTNYLLTFVTLHHSAIFDLDWSLIYSVPHCLATAPRNSSATYGAYLFIYLLNH